MELRKIIQDELRKVFFGTDDSKEIEEIDLSVGGHGQKPGIGRKFPASDKEGGHSLNLSVDDGPHKFPHEEDF